MQLALAVCLVGVLFSEPLKNTLAYVTSSPAKVVNTFVGETETTSEETKPDDTSDEPTAPDETKDSSSESVDSSDESTGPYEESPQTGVDDSREILLYLFVMTVSIAVFCVMQYCLKRQRENEKERHEK